MGIVVAGGTGAAEPIVERTGGAVSFSGSDPVTGKRVSLDDYVSRIVGETDYAGVERGLQAAVAES